jgi:hypothetical protein
MIFAKSMYLQYYCLNFEVQGNLFTWEFRQQARHPQNSHALRPPLPCCVT